MVLQHYTQHFTLPKVLEKQPTINSTIFFNFETDILYINREWKYGKNMNLAWETELDEENGTGNVSR